MRRAYPVRVVQGLSAEVLYAASNVVVTVLVVVRLDTGNAAGFNILLAVLSGTVGVLRGMVGESVAIRLRAGDGTSRQLLRREALLPVLVSFVAFATAAATAGVGGAAAWAVTLLSLGGLNCAYGVWRAARAASIPGAVLACDGLWLVVQLLVYAVLAAGGLSAVELAAGWGAGLTVASASAVVLEGRAAQPPSPTAITSVSGARWAYATEGALAFAGPHLTVLGAALVLDAASISEFRAILVILGPMAIIGSGIRLVFVGRDPTGGSVTPARFAVLSLGVGTIVAIGAVVLVDRLHATGVFTASPVPVILVGTGLVAIARTAGTIASLSLARLRGVAGSQEFLGLRLITVGLALGGVVGGALIGDLGGALIGVAGGTSLAMALYVHRDRAHSGATTAVLPSASRAERVPANPPLS